MKVLAQEPMLTDALPLGSTHNFKAQILRSGLVVSAFSVLESFLETRLEEKIRDLRGSSIRYRSFDDVLRRFFSVAAVQGLVTRASFLEASDQISYVEQHLSSVGAFSRTRPIYTAQGFSPKGSNIRADDISSLMTAFGLNGGWGMLQTLCGRVGSARISFKNDFQNFLKARNKAAHDGANANIATGDLLIHIETATLTGITVDLALSFAIDCFVKATSAANAATAAATLGFVIRFIDEQPNGVWKERLEPGRPVQNHANLKNAISVASSRKADNFLIVRNARSFPTQLL